ncbi:MAG: 30S ribosomal protein S20 [Calditrichia bacterium]
MAHHKSAIKRIEIAERNRERNRFYRSTMRTSIKEVLNSETKENAFENFKKASSLLDKLVTKGIIHRNLAANKKSRLMRHVNSLA